VEEADASEYTSALGRYDWRIGLLDNQVDFKRIQYFLFEKRLSQRAKRRHTVRQHFLGAFVIFDHQSFDLMINFQGDLLAKISARRNLPAGRAGARWLRPLHRRRLHQLR